MVRAYPRAGEVEAGSRAGLGAGRARFDGPDRMAAYRRGRVCAGRGARGRDRREWRPVEMFSLGVEARYVAFATAAEFGVTPLKLGKGRKDDRRTFAPPVVSGFVTAAVAVAF